MRREGQHLGTAARSWSRPGAVRLVLARLPGEHQRQSRQNPAVDEIHLTAAAELLFIPSLENIRRMTKWRICGYYC